MTTEQFKPKLDRQILKDKILIARELARQCSENIENQTPEEDENEIVYKAIREIVSWQVKDGLTSEEISQITRAFGERLKELEKKRIDDKVNALLKSIDSTIDQNKKAEMLNTKKTNEGDLDLEKKDGSAA